MKKTFALIIAVIMLLALSACQTTPKEVFIVQKDTERMVQQAVDDTTGTKVSKLKVPDGNYTYQTSAADGRLTINVDALVTVPESEIIPMAKVSQTGLTQEEVTAFFNYLFPDETPVTGDNVPRVMTKGDIQELIVLYKKYIAEGTTEEYTLYTVEELEEEIKNLEKQYESAPETAPELDIQESDSMMTTELTEGDKYAGEELLRLDAGTEDKRIFVTVPLEENGHWQNYFSFHRHEESPREFSEMNAVKIDETNWQTATDGKLMITYEDAKQLCEDFFNAGNVSNVVLSDAFIVDDEMHAPNDERRNGPTSGPENYAYQFEYVRTVCNSPVANMTFSFGFGDDNSLPWGYETIMFWVDDDGIFTIRWDCHTTTGEVISEDTGVIDFEEAQEIFETMIVTTYGANEHWRRGLSEVSVDIDNIELSLVRVREQNAFGRNGIYTPAWIFYGNVKQKYEGDYEHEAYGWDHISPYPFTKFPVLVINAVDGSIVDPAKGY